MDNEQETLAIKETNMSLLRCSAVRHVDAKGTVVEVGIVEAVDCVQCACLIGELAEVESLQTIRYTTRSIKYYT